MVRNHYQEFNTVSGVAYFSDYVMNTKTSVTRFNELIYTDIGYSYRSIFDN